MNEQVLLELLEKKDFKTIRSVLSVMNPVDIASLLEELDDEGQIAITFRLILKDKAADAFSYMSGERQEILLNSFTNKEIKDILDTMFTDDTVDLLEDMPANVVNRILANLDKDTRARINEILLYPEDSAGSVMTTEYIDLRPNMTVSDALAKIKRVGIYSETIYTCYVTEKGRLLGSVSAKDLLTSENDILVSELMETNIITAKTTDDKEEVSKLFSKYGLPAIPVVDSENCIVGIVTYDDAFEVMENETTEDINIMAAITPTEKAYLKMSPFDLWKARIPWLLLLMISATFTGMIISNFEAALNAFPVLIAFIPMLMDTGGNSGSQASVTVIRGIALGDVGFRDIFRVQSKEIITALLCGVTLAAANFCKMCLVDMLLLNTGVTYIQAAVVCLTIAVTVLLAKVVGCTLPLLAKKIGFDPAVMASPFITTIVDALSLLIYFGIASLILM